MPPVRRRVFVQGKVQGVWFRGSTVAEAERIGGLTGWARNLDDGRVEVLVEGEADAVDRLVAYCGRGPPSARVDDLAVTSEPFVGDLQPFSVRR